MVNKGHSFTCFVKNYFIQSEAWFINTESIFIEIFVPKLKSVLIGILNRPPDKYDL